ncbi:MAG: IS3 family transposase, partial [Clostridia bacterium]|nr:IS3 family transposase [Clostridia bacterium]MBR5292703.1 IS3 family transposase [Clostridia bacterium]MBR5292952.1 IS3 family transposase [Clostridia bacterium]MBR5293104.1 IS3 family transposase [Clostridia bacterium]
TQSLIRSFISYYNSQRPQWALNKLTPFEFRSQLL